MNKQIKVANCYMASGFEKGQTPKTVVSVWSVAQAQHSCAFEIQRKNVWSELVVSREKTSQKLWRTQKDTWSSI